jgi:hypothetical protein
LANATPPSDIVNANMSATNNNDMRFLIFFTSFPSPKQKPTRLST